MVEIRHPHVLVVSTRLDVSTDAVVRTLSSFGARCTRINTEDFPFNARITSVFGGSRSGAMSVLCGDMDHSADWLDDLSSIWYRRVRAPARPDEMMSGVYDFSIRESRAALLGALLARPERIMSPPVNVWKTEHKLLQLAAARDAGLTVPDTVVTNDPNEVRAAFTRFGGQMIAKPVRTGYVDYGDEQHAVYTTQVLAEHLAEVDSARWSPAIYQPLISKRCDVRVTVVGSEFFVAEIDSQGDPAAVVDWRRTKNAQLPHRRSELPSHVRIGVDRLFCALGLKFGALDFVRTPDDEYIFLEVNPNGQWLWLDDMLGFDITGAIARWLVGVDA